MALHSGKKFMVSYPLSHKVTSFGFSSNSASLPIEVYGQSINKTLIKSG